jgi:hypothetical protein
MMNRTGWLLLCAPLATAGMLLPMTTGGCQSNEVGGGSGNIGNIGNTGGSGNIGNTGGSGNTGNTGNTGGTGGGQTACGVGTTAATIQDITTGAVGTGVAVTVTGAVVMSQKYLVTTSGSGNCLWGVFVSAPGLPTTAANTGILAVSYGNPATIPDGGTKAYCPKIDDNSAVTGDAIPDQVQPGDVVTIIGTTDKFLLNNCATEDAGAAVGQFQIAQVCSVTVTQSGGAVPAPAVISGADLARLSSPTDTEFHDQWGGVKVRINAPSAQASGVGGGNSVVGDYGIITLDQNDIQVGDGIYYRGYQKSNPCYAGPVFDGPMTWTSIDGFSVLDYCTWGLAVNDKCSDFNPQSTDCTVATCAPY